VLVALVGASCTKPKPLVCDGPTTPPGESEPCPPGTRPSPQRCPLETCRQCERPDRTREGPFATWYTSEVHIEVIPDEHGHWGNYTEHVRGRVQEAGWFKNGVRNRWSEQGAALDGGAGWLTPPDGGA